MIQYMPLHWGQISLTVNTTGTDPSTGKVGKVGGSGRVKKVSSSGKINKISARGRTKRL